MTIYDIVKQLADEKNMSIAEVERTAGIANGTIGKWKNGKPKLESVVKVAKALDTEISVIVPY